MTRIYNALIKAFNDFQKMPRFILIVANEDLLNHVKGYHAGISKPSTIALEWMVKFIEQAMDTKKELLIKAKPGVVTAFEPKVVWVKAINYAELKSIYKLNRCLEEVLSKQDNSYVLDVNAALKDGAFYTLDGHLNGAGKVKFWKEIDYQIELFEARRLSLKPILHEE